MTVFRGGLSTGTCAAAAAKAAALALSGSAIPAEVEVSLPDGSRERLSVSRAGRCGHDRAEAVVRKDAGDDPDVTNAAEIVASLQWAGHSEVQFRAGEGVGTITKPGLALAPGEPAINPVPRRMIAAAVREVTPRGVEVTVAVPGGAELAKRTYNPRLGIEGGLSILGTTGRVRPFSTPALEQALACALAVARACGVTSPVLVPGHIGERAARGLFRTASEQLIEVGNAWGLAIAKARDAQFRRLLVVGHAGKLVKIIAGHWDTHSSRSPSAVPTIARVIQRVLGRRPPASAAAEGMLAGLAADDCRQVVAALAALVAHRIGTRFRGPVAVALVDLQGKLLGSSGDLSPWQ